MPTVALLAWQLTTLLQPHGAASITVLCMPEGAGVRGARGRVDGGVQLGAAGLEEGREDGTAACSRRAIRARPHTSVVSVIKDTDAAACARCAPWSRATGGHLQPWFGVA